MMIVNTFLVVIGLVLWFASFMWLTRNFIDRLIDIDNEIPTFLVAIVTFSVVYGGYFEFIEVKWDIYLALFIVLGPLVILLISFLFANAWLNYEERKWKRYRDKYPGKDENVQQMLERLKDRP